MVELGVRGEKTDADAVGAAREGCVAMCGGCVGGIADCVALEAGSLNKDVGADAV